MSFRIPDTSPQSLYVLNTFLSTVDNVLYNFDGNNILAGTIKAKAIDVDTLFVGVGGIKIDPSATISWGQIPDRPEIPDLTNYVTSSMLNTTLQDYASVSDLTVALTDYVTDGTLSSNLDDLLVYSNLSTLIGQDYFITGKIAANQIAAGLISGNTIRTSSTTTYSYLHEQYLDIVYGNASKMQFGYQNYGGLGTVPYIAFTADSNTSYIAEYNSGLELKYGGSTIDLYNDHVIINTPTLNLGAATVATREWVSANAPQVDLTNYIHSDGSHKTTFTDGVFIDTTGGYARFQKDASNYVRLGTDKCEFMFSSGSLCDVRPDGFYVNGTKIGTTTTATVIPVFA